MAASRRSTRVPKQPLDLHERALRLLSVRPRSRRELRMRLVRAGFETDEVEDELERLEAVGLIDDDAFARQVAEHEVSVRRSGRRAVADRLFALGVERATVDRTLEELGDLDEDAGALELARVRARRLGSLDPEVGYRRLVSFLQRRGYAWGTAHRAAAEALGPNRG